jgi:hypothetical protein
MSQRLISLSSDLKRLRDEGYEVETRAGYLIIHNVPYVDAERRVQRGTLVSNLNLAGETTASPDPHTVTFAGSTPCDRDGIPLDRIMAGSAKQKLAEGLEIDHTFSSKPSSGRYSDYYEKMTTYAAILSGPAHALDPSATPRTFAPVEDSDQDTPFVYVDTASSRAGIAAIGAKLRVGPVAIVGIGGTGSYVLDLVAKTPVQGIHLFDGDVFLQHNAFRAPGAPSIEELRRGPGKAEYFRSKYTPMRHDIVAHSEPIDATNVEVLGAMSFAFLTIDDGPTKKLIVDELEKANVAFIDAGMGLYEADGALGGQLRITASTPEKRTHVHERARIPFAAAGAHDDYAQNIQIAELNALNAALAVIRWKKLAGFYLDLEHEHFSVYAIDGNSLLNEDQS